MKEFNLLKKRVEEAVSLISSLKEEKVRLQQEVQSLKETIKFLEEENREIKKTIAHAERLGKERKEIRQRLQVLLDRLESVKI